MADDVVFIDVVEGSKRVMNNAKLYAKLLVKFKDDPNLKDLDAAMAAGDMEKAKTAVHTIKGLSANLSLIELYKQSLELETQIKAGSVKPNQMTILKDVFSKTLTEVDKVVAQYG
jgi:HPt (histidine-containing phosphotransfer) domain-containing protein